MLVDWPFPVSAGKHDIPTSISAISQLDARIAVYREDFLHLAPSLPVEASGLLSAYFTRHAPQLAIIAKSSCSNSPGLLRLIADGTHHHAAQENA